MNDLGTIIHGDRERFWTKLGGQTTVIIRDAEGNGISGATLDDWAFRFTGRLGSSTGTVAFALTTENGGVEIVDAEARIIRVNLKPEDYEAVPLVGAGAVIWWDLEGTAPGDGTEVHTLDRGKLLIIPGSTR